MPEIIRAGHLRPQDLPNPQGVFEAAMMDVAMENPLLPYEKAKQQVVNYAHERALSEAQRIAQETGGQNA